MSTWRRLLISDRAWFALVAAVLILGGAWTWWGRAPDAAGPARAGSAPQTGFIAPDFTLETLDGETVALSGLRGQALVINLWATWCSPCRAEMPAVERVWNDYRDQLRRSNGSRQWRETRSLESEWWYYQRWLFPAR